MFLLEMSASLERSHGDLPWQNPNDMHFMNSLYINISLSIRSQINIYTFFRNFRKSYKHWKYSNKHHLTFRSHATLHKNSKVP